MATSGSFYMFEMVTKAVPDIDPSSMKEGGEFSRYFSGKRSKQLPDIAFKSFARKDLRP